MPDLTDLVPDDVADAAPVRFPTKIAVVLATDLAPWQSLNVTAFTVSAVAAADPTLIGEPYADADGTSYLPMVGQPILLFEADGARLRQVHAAGLARGFAMAVYTRELFSTGNDRDNRAAVAAVRRDDLDLVGLALRGPRNAVDKVTKGLALHR
ncbi:DUF2000 domain-containing protein [Lapillicoccus jejuensis]|uniref:DUF2000 domain-containing protein n=1 Tax=Lapillicoccus jejuensis TaxID=402171 RepID=A0A542E4J6_9MICO|nr:DUF2000 domain-containing protein [Lapillicoccus jejuensis]TQJ10268.1 hypothetical protein FB458_3388 [Lapillicoccus jejuensis]